MTTADTLRLRDRLLAELRDSGRPLSTTELAARMPWRIERSEDSCALLCQRATPNPDAHVIECHGNWHVVAYRRTTHGYSGIYRHLRSLERHGMVRRALHDGHKRVCWVYTGPDQPAVAAADPDATVHDVDIGRRGCGKRADRHHRDIEVNHRRFYREGSGQ